MKKFASILFVSVLMLAVVAARYQMISPESLLLTGLIAFIGLFFCADTFKDARKRGYAALHTVPGKYVITNTSGELEEVPFMTRAEKALYDQLVTLTRANPVTFKAIQEGGISFDPISYYIRYDITGLAGSILFLGPGTQRLVGTSNFPLQATLQQYYNFCFDRIAIKTALTNTADTAVGAVTQWSAVSASVDPAVRNGELLIRSNRNTILETPVTDFLSDAAVSGGGTREFGGGLLEKPRFFLEMLQAEGQLNFAGTVGNTANTTTWLEVQFMGVQARLKA